MEAKTYNGWTNYETWCTKLWMDNDEYSYREYQRMARSANSAYELAKMIEAEHEEMMPELTGVFADLLGAAMSEVNWDEIAEHMYEDEHEDDEEEEDEETEDEDEA